MKTQSMLQNTSEFFSMRRNGSVYIVGIATRGSAVNILAGVVTAAAVSSLYCDRWSRI